MLSNIMRFIFRSITLIVLIFLVSCAGYVGIRGNQPMSISQAPAGITYWEFIQDRLAAAEEVKPARCGTGKLAFFVIVTPFYSALFTHVGIYPDGFLAKVTMRDSNIPTGASDAGLAEVPDIWWGTVERLSWSALARRTPACNLRPVRLLHPKE